MVGCRLWIMGVGCALALAAPVGGAAAESEQQLLATLDKPAVVTVEPGPVRGPGQSPRVEIIVTGFQPPLNEKEAVQAVVKAKQEGSETEPVIGRFSIFPNTQFKAADPSKGRRFGNFPLPKELAGGGPVKLTVQLVPFENRGPGTGATLQLGGAEIR